MSLKKTENSKPKAKIVKRANTDGDEPYDIFYESIESFIKAFTAPEKNAAVRFPNQFPIPTYLYRMETAFTLRTNSYGNCLVEIHFGQYCDVDSFKTGLAGSQNGTSNVGNSNVFICDDETLTGLTQVSNVGTVMRANDAGSVKYSGLYNAITII